MTQIEPYKNGVMKADEIQILEQAGIIPKGTPAGQIALFGKVCSEKNLSPFSRQIHLIKRSVKVGEKYEDRYTIQTAIDGYRLQAERTGKYAGNDDYKYNGGLSEYDMIESKFNPITATSTVYKIVEGVRCPFSATARWDEYYPGEKQGFMWKKMPFLMLGKCAEALALRKAFPEALSGIYTDEEMQQADSKTDITELPEVKQIVDRNYTKEAEACLTESDYKGAFKRWWNSLTKEERNQLSSLKKHILEVISEMDNKDPLLSMINGLTKENFDSEQANVETALMSTASKKYDEIYLAKVKELGYTTDFVTVPF